MTVPRDLVIPTGPGQPPVNLKSGDKVMVIKTAKGNENFLFIFITEALPDKLSYKIMSL